MVNGSYFLLRIGNDWMFFNNSFNTLVWWIILKYNLRGEKLVNFTTSSQGILNNIILSFLFALLFFIWITVFGQNVLCNIPAREHHNSKFIIPISILGDRDKNFKDFMMASQDIAKTKFGKSNCNTVQKIFF